MSSVSPRRSSPPRKTATKKGKKGQSKEDAERLLREERERQEREELLRREREAEERQRYENDARDRAESRDKKRLKKEAQAAALTEKEATIVHLTAQVNDIGRNYSAMKMEMEDELQRLLHLKEMLENELSNVQAEGQLAVQQLTEERNAALQSLDEERKRCSLLQRSKDEADRAADEKAQDLNRQVTQLSAEVTLLRTTKTEQQDEFTKRLKMLEGELEKAMALNKTYEEVIESRDSNDRKNVALMELLSAQIEEHKRKANEAIDGTQKQRNQLSDAVEQWKTRTEQVEKEKYETERQRDEAVKEAQTLVAEYKAKLEQMKFDTKFLHSELNIYKAKLNSQKQEHEELDKLSSTDRHGLQKDLHESGQKVETLEQALRKKDRDHFDKVTFLNAQISNNRTIILQLQNKLQLEKESRLQEVSTLSEEMQRKAKRIAEMENEHDRTRLQQTETQVKLNGDVATLKTTTFQLQSALLDKERQFDNILAEKDDEIKRLRRKLDEAFIPHRSVK